MVSSYIFLKLIRRVRRKRQNAALLDIGEAENLKASIQATKKPVYDLNMCRVCLKTGSIPIFGSKDLSEDLIKYAGISPSISDNFPKYLCTSCNALLEGAIIFRKTAQETNQVLISSEEHAVSVKDSDFMHQEYLYKANDNDAGTDEEDIEAQLNMLQKQAVKRNPFHCAICKLDFQSIEEYSKHRFTEGHNPYRASCPICKKHYTSIYLKKHIALQHNHVESPFMCDICGKTFKVMVQCDRHRKTHFVDDLPFKCPICPYRGRFKESVKEHMRTHTGEKPYACPYCPARTSKKSNLNKHMLIHKTEFDFKCHTCGKGYHTKRQLEEHFLVHHSGGIKAVLCDICGKAFSYRKLMMKHQLKVHKRKKIKIGNPLYLKLAAKNQHSNEQQRNLSYLVDNGQQYQ